jgi:hypothetical protein
MSIWNKVLIGLICVAAIICFILGARALKTHKHWRGQVVQLEKALATELETTEKLTGEIRQLKLQLHEQVVDRGRAWFRCTPQPTPETQRTGAVAVAVQLPDPHQITLNSVLWVFDELPIQKGGRYLGQFAVTGVDDTSVNVALTPSKRLTQAELQRLVQSAARQGATWALYEIMPIDNHHSLAGLPEDVLRAVLPEQTVDEYILDGQLMTLGEMKQRGLAGNVYRIDANEEIVKVDGLPQEVGAEDERGKYVRQLRDYEELFRQHGLDRTMLQEGIARTERNVRYIQEANADATRQFQYRQEERDRLKDTELPKAVRERDLVVAHQKVVEGALAALQASIQETIDKNLALAGEIARIQREATRIIDERTRAMAQADVGN